VAACTCRASGTKPTCFELVRDQDLEGGKNAKGTKRWSIQPTRGFRDGSRSARSRIVVKYHEGGSGRATKAFRGCPAFAQDLVSTGYRAVPGIPRAAKPTSPPRAEITRNRRSWAGLAKRGLCVGASAPGRASGSVRATHRHRCCRSSGERKGGRASKAKARLGGRFLSTPDGTFRGDRGFNGYFVCGPEFRGLETVALGPRTLDPGRFATKRSVSCEVAGLE